MRRTSASLAGCLALPALALAAPAATPPTPSDANWLVGTWALCDDPDGGAKDHVRFDADGRGVSLGARGRNHPFAYRLVGSRVQAIADYDGRPVPFAYTFAPDRDRLVFQASSAAHNSVYVRQGTEQAHGCSAR